MKLFAAVVAMIIASSAAAAQVQLTANQTAAPPARDSAALERLVGAYLQPLLRTNNFSGVILLAAGDRVLLNKGYGYASIEHQVANGTETVFQIASVSKPFTAAAILLLAEQKKVDLKAPLAAILPDYPNGETLTLHHLLTHTSGIPNINDFPEYDDVQRRAQNPEQLVGLFKNKPLEFEPGAGYSYSNSNYNLLALVIEKVSGTDYGRFVESAVIDPLGLKQTGHKRSESLIVPNMATGYAPSGSVGLERAGFLDWTAKTGNGSLYSDAQGIFRFIRGVHEGQLLAPASVAATFTPHTPNSGYGWFLSEANGRDIHHVNGRSPGFAAHADYYVGDGITIVVLANTYISVTTAIARAIGALYFGTPVEPMPALRSEPLDPSASARLIGEYQFGPDYYVPNAKIIVAARGGHLEAMVGEYGPYPFVAITPTRFLIRSFWVPAEFTLGRDNRATELVIDGRKGVRVARP